jgi:ribosomal 30S subunit maturation factor RimM
LIEPGWEVVDAQGESLGKVEEVLGDKEADIFDGLNVATGLLGEPTYIPAEKVGEIVEGQIKLAR